MTDFFHKEDIISKKGLKARISAVIIFNKDTAKIMSMYHLKLMTGLGMMAEIPDPVSVVTITFNVICIFENHSRPHP